MKIARTWPALLLLSALFGACGADDPYDPTLGPRRPRPGAERYLSTRADIAESQKLCLLNFAPCPEDTLTRLVDAPSREVRSLVAANPSATPSILEQLSRDRESGVRQYVASNPRTPAAIVARLAGDADENVRQQTARRDAKRP